MVGEIVTVLERVQTGTDAFNAPVWEWQGTDVENVLVVPGARENVTDETRPEGVRVAYTLHFPKTYTGELTWQKVVVRGHECAVTGHPDRYIEDDCPTEWNLPVEVVRTDG